MIDDKPLLRYDDFISRLDIMKKDNGISDTNFGWNIIILSGYIEKGCHEIEMLGLDNQKIVEIEQKVDICRI